MAKLLENFPGGVRPSSFANAELSQACVSSLSLGLEAKLEPSESPALNKRGDQFAHLQENDVVYPSQGIPVLTGPDMSA